MRRILSRFAFPLLAAAGALVPIAPLHPQDAFERRELTIPVRDGVKLFAVALVPKSMAAPLPIMLIRTPYSAAGAFRTAQLPGSYKELAEDGYIFVTEDVRGRYGSDGLFIMNGALHDPKNPKGVDEATDTWDTIDWLVKNVPNNSGKVGVMGVSYPGWLAGRRWSSPRTVISVCRSAATIAMTGTCSSPP